MKSKGKVIITPNPPAGSGSQEDGPGQLLKSSIPENSIEEEIVPPKEANGQAPDNGPEEQTVK